MSKPAQLMQNMKYNTKMQIRKYFGKKVLLIGGKTCKFLVEDNYFNEMLIVECYENTLTSKMENRESLAKAFEEKRDLTIVDLTNVVEEVIKKQKTVDEVKIWIDSWKDLLKPPYNKEVLLLKIHRPEYYVVGTHVRKTVVNQYREVIDEIEQYFAECTGCFVTGFEDGYFSQKQKGKKVELYTFEEEYYWEIANRVWHYYRLKKNEFSDRPEMRYNIKRVKRLYKTLERKAFLKFLDPQILLECLLWYATPEFLNEYGSLIEKVEAELGRNCQIDEIESCFSKDASEKEQQFVAIMRVVDAFMREEFDASECDALPFFKAGLRCPQLLELMREMAAEKKESLGLQHKKVITFYNYGVFYPVLFERSEEEKERYLRELTADSKEKKVTLPFVVDIWGSCISRVNFNFDDEKTFVVDQYHFQVPPFVQKGQILYDKELISEYDVWYDRNTQNQLNGTVCTQIAGSSADWIVIDFFGLSSKRAYQYGGRVFVDYYGNIAKALGAEKVNMDAIPMDVLKDRVKEFAEFIKERYGTNIIFIHDTHQDLYISHENTVKEFVDADRNRFVTERLREIGNYFVSICDCYEIQMNDKVLADELGFMMLSPVHYEDVVYQDILDVIHTIIESKPEKKRWDELSTRTMISRDKRYKNTKKKELLPDRAWPIALLDVSEE